jgi:acetate kinase
MHILVINSGSSSIKFRLFDMEQERVCMSGLLERIGESEGHASFRNGNCTNTGQQQEDHSPIADHAVGLQHIFAFLQNGEQVQSNKPVQAVGHRVVHGGEDFHAPVRIDQHVMDTIRSMIPLAPLHNPANLAGIEAIHKLWPEMPQVAVFDTAFFHTLPAVAHRYALPEDLYHRYHVRRYGFHGTSHHYVAGEAAHYLQRPLQELRLITLHLGNGASAAAIREGHCIDTSMGMTPLEGLVMGTRCGDLDPAIHFYLARTAGMDFNEIEHLLNHDSGLMGLCGTRDMREIHRLASDGDERACLALDLFCYRIAKYIGAYYIALGGLDALVFSGGIGENDPQVRHTICAYLGVIGIHLDEASNGNPGNGIADISSADNTATVLVIPSNEELAIARQTLSVLEPTGGA